MDQISLNRFSIGVPVRVVDSVAQALEHRGDDDPRDQEDQRRAEKALIMHGSGGPGLVGCNDRSRV